MRQIERVVTIEEITVREEVVTPPCLDEIVENAEMPLLFAAMRKTRVKASIKCWKCAECGKAGKWTCNPQLVQKFPLGEV